MHQLTLLLATFATASAADTVILVPLPSCTKITKNICYQGSQAAITQIETSDPLACKPPTDATLYVGNCSAYGFGIPKGNDPIFKQVELWERGGSSNHLWFRVVDYFGGDPTTCGDVDAAPRMPASLFFPSNAAALKEYEDVTIMFWFEGGKAPGGGKLELGRCADLQNSDGRPVGFTKPAGNKTIQWVGSQGCEYRDCVMAKACNANCNCDFERGTCKDVPDDPTSKKWCSLCGPKFNADIEVNLYSRASKDIVALAQAVPSLSTLVAAVVAGNLTSVLSSPGPFTVFAPNNDAFDKLPAATLKHLLNPANIKELVAILELHVVSGVVYAKDLSDKEKITTVNGGELTVSIVGSLVFIASAGTEASTVTAADNAATNGIVHIINTVLLPSS